MKNYRPASFDDHRRKLDDSQMKIMEAQLLADEVTIRQAASHNRIRTKYINKINRMRSVEAQDEYYKPGEIESLIEQCIQCETCEHWFFPEILEAHKIQWKGQCLRLKGKSLLLD